MPELYSLADGSSTNAVMHVVDGPGGPSGGDASRGPVGPARCLRTPRAPQKAITALPKCRCGPPPQAAPVTLTYRCAEQLQKLCAPLRSPVRQPARTSRVGNAMLREHARGVSRRFSSARRTVRKRGSQCQRYCRLRPRLRSSRGRRGCAGGCGGAGNWRCVATSCSEANPSALLMNAWILSTPSGSMRGPTSTMPAR